MRKLASHAVVYGIGGAANQALSFLLLPLYTRYLEPAHYGTLAVVAAAGMILSFVAAAGVHSGLIRIYFLYEHEREREAVVFTALAFAVAAASVVAAGLLALAPGLAPQLLGVPESTRLVRLAIGVYAVLAVRSVAFAVLQVHGRPAAYVGASFLGVLVSLALTIYLVAVAGWGVRGVLIGQLCGGSVELGLALAASLPRLRPVAALRPLREMLGFALPLLPMNLAAWGLGFADRYFLKAYSGYADVGLYALGFKFGAVLELFLVTPFSIAWFPYMFSITGQPDHREVYARTLEHFVLLGALALVGVSLFGGDVIRLIADPAYFAAEAVIFWVALGFLLRGMTFITVAGIHIRRKTHYSSAVYVAGAALNLALLRLLVPPLGMFGAALALVGSYAAIGAGYYVLAQRLYPIPYRMGRVAGVLLLAGAAVAVSRLGPEAPLAFALAGKLGLLAAFGVVLVGSGLVARDDLLRARGLLIGLARAAPK